MITVIELQNQWNVIPLGVEGGNCKKNTFTQNAPYFIFQSSLLLELNMTKKLPFVSVSQRQNQ